MSTLCWSTQQDGLCGFRGFCQTWRTNRHQTVRLAGNIDKNSYYTNTHTRTHAHRRKLCMDIHWWQCEAQWYVWLLLSPFLGVLTTMKYFFIWAGPESLWLKVFRISLLSTLWSLWCWGLIILLIVSNRFLFNQVDCGHFEQYDLAQGILKMSFRARVCPPTGAEPVPLCVDVSKNTQVFLGKGPFRVPPCFFSVWESPNCMCLV